MDYTLGDFLLSEIKRRGMSQREFADFLGVSYHSFVDRIINGTFRPKLETLELLAEKIHAPIEMLLTLVSPELARSSRLSPRAWAVAREYDKLTDVEQSIIWRAMFGGAESDDSE